ncbi:MAG: hypothetical protein BRD34_03960 [Bacteroidetes bacterium QH_6_64_77]|nr:MAG: hypothetical protein BRD34_03960 [Bacteroidetes bacterium QH_6_64_77]
MEPDRLMLFYRFGVALVRGLFTGLQRGSERVPLSNAPSFAITVIAMRVPSLVGIVVLGLVSWSPAAGQAPEPGQDSSHAWHEDAWTRIVEQEGVRISYIYYPEADNEHDGIVLRLINENDVPVQYAFTLVFRAPEADTSVVVRGRLAPGEMKTGDDAGLFWVPFRGEDRSVGEIGLRGLDVWTARASRSGQPSLT